MTQMTHEADPGVFAVWTDEQFSIWFAGFFDGEGCIYLPKDTGICVSVSNTHPQSIYGIFGRLDMGALTVTTNSDPRNKTKYTWAVKRYDEAQLVLKMIRPFLVIKAPKADQALAFIEERLNERVRRIQRNNEIVALIENGMTHKDVAAKFGITRSSVTQVVAATKRGYWRASTKRSLSSHQTTKSLTKGSPTRSRLIARAIPSEKEAVDQETES